MTNDPTNWNPDPNTGTLVFATPEDAKRAEALFNKMSDEISRLTRALEKIEDFTNGYGDVAAVACKIARQALRPDSSDAAEGGQ